MKKYKIFAPIIGVTSAASLLTPIMVSCSKQKPEIICYDEKHRTITNVGDTFSYICKYTGEVKSKYETIQDGLVVTIGVYHLVDNQEKMCSYVNINNRTETECHQTTLYTNRLGNFKFDLTAREIPSDLKQMKFYLKILVVDKSITEYILDGFQFNYES